MIFSSRGDLKDRKIKLIPELRVYSFKLLILTRSPSYQLGPGNNLDQTEIIDPLILSDTDPSIPDLLLETDHSGVDPNQD